MTSKEINDMIIDLENQIKQFGEMITLTNQLNILKSYKQDLERLEHYDLIKSDMNIFEQYRDDLNYICNLLNTYCKDSEDWNKIVFKFQSIIGAINCCQLQQGAYERLEVLEQSNNILNELSNNQHETITNLTEENEKLKKAIEIMIREKIKPSAFLGILKDYKYHNKIDIPYEKVSIYLDCKLTQQEYELLKEVLGNV